MTVDRPPAGSERIEIAPEAARFRVLGELAPIGIYQTDVQGRCQYVNERWCAIAGLTPEEAAGEGWARAIHPDDRERVFGEWRAATERGEAFASEYRFCAPDGRVTWLLGNARPLVDERGVTTGYLGTVTDVSEQKRAEARAQRLQALTAALVEVSDPELIARAGVEQAVAAMEASAGVAALRAEDGSLEVIYAHGYPDVSVLPWRRIDAGAKVPLAEAARTGASVFVSSLEELAARYPEVGGPRPGTGSASLAALPLFAGGKVAGALGFSFPGGHAFTHREVEFLEAIARQCAQAIERARLREADRAAARKVEAALRAKDEFLAILGHELRNPLSPITTALQLMQLRAGTLFEKERAIIARQVQHMERLVDDLLDVSRITRGKIELRRQPVELGQVVAKALEMASPLLERQEHRVEVEVPAEGLRVDGDEHRLAQVISNLLTNAAKYTPRGGAVRVWAGREGAEVVLCVRDSGIGIPADLLPRLFDAFVQGERVLERSQGGLGLGLTIVQSLVVMHGGSVTAESEGPGQGSLFTVRLPALAEAAPAPAAGAAAATPARADARRILVVDDNEDAAQMLAEALEVFGHKARVAFDGPTAIGVAGAFHPDVALLDIGLPVMDGHELARRLRELPGLGDLKLVAVTGYGQLSDVERSRSAGFHEHVVKPINVDRLELVISSLFG